MFIISPAFLPISRVIIAAIPPAIIAVSKYMLINSWLCGIISLTDTSAPFLALLIACRVANEKTKFAVLIPPISIMNPWSPSLRVICMLIIAAVDAPTPGSIAVSNPERLLLIIAFTLLVFFITMLFCLFCFGIPWLFFKL